MRSIKYVLSLALVAAVVACGPTNSNGNGNGNGGGGGAVTADNFATKAQSALCAYMTRCVPEMEYAFCSGGLNVDLGYVSAEVKAGRLGFDTAKAQSCLNDIGSLACASGLNGLNAQISDCSAVLVAKVQTGGACANDSECVDGTCQGQTCPDHCVANAAVGADCSNAGCTHGAYCDSTTNKCTAVQANGGSCNDNSDCQSGYCAIGNGSSQGQCAAPNAGNAGATCSSDNDCASGLFCDMAGESGTCKADIAKGQPCGTQSDPASGVSGCGPQLVCLGFAVSGGSSGQMTVTAGTCSSWVGNGGTCTATPAGAEYAMTGCELSLACVNGKCAPAPTSGPCAADPASQCAMNYSCDTSGATPVCKSDNACQSASDCGGKPCQNGVCAQECTM